MIYWRIIGQLAGRQIRHYLAVIFHHHLAGIGHKPNLRPRQIPFIKNAFHLFLAPLGDDDEHALLRFAQQNLVGRHARAALRHLGQINLNARAAARSRFAGGTREARRAHVLNARHRAGRQQFQTGLHAELLHEGISHLHGTALLFGRFLGEILRGKCRTRQAIPAGGRSDIKHRIAHALGRTPRNLIMPQYA